MKMYYNKEDRNPSLKVLHKPMHSTFLGRILYYSYYLWLQKYFLTIEKSTSRRNDLRFLGKTILFLIGMVTSIVVTVGFRCTDVFEVYTARDYDRPSKVYGKDRQGNPVHFATFSSSARKVIQLAKKASSPPETESSQETTDDLMPKVVTTLLISEDTNFYYHFGIDITGIVRALITNTIYGEIREGASTISQQVARLRFLRHERSYLRKMREMFLSFLLESFYTKNKILEDYLNMVPLGHGTYGVNAAAAFYFDKDFRELSWGEGALIVALTTRPKEFSPLLNPRQSRKKTKITLQKLIRAGKISILEAESEYRKLETNYFLKLNRSPNDTAFHRRKNDFPYASAYVHARLPEKFKSNFRLYRNGYRIYTTINTTYQQAAQETVAPYLRELSKRKKRPPFRNIEIFDQEFEALNQITYGLFDMNMFINRQTKQERDFQRDFSYSTREELHLLSLVSGTTNLPRAIAYQMQNEEKLDALQNIEGALISIIPNSGEIAAVIGGSEYSSRNRQLRFRSIRRQSGSAFKPLIVAAALQLTKERVENGKAPITPASLFEDTPLHFINEDLSEFSPDNYSKEYEGKMTLRRALTRSKNSIAIQLYQRAGVSQVNRIVEKILHLENNSLTEDFTIPLGTLGVSPLQMARAFAMFANGGWDYKPYLIERIERISTGEILYTAPPQTPVQILDVEVAETLASMMSDVISQGTGKLARLVGRDTAGKTGTTNNNTNAWFAGFVKQLVTIVYLGYDIPKSMGVGATGGGFAAPLWGKYMLKALRRTPNLPFAYPDSQVKRLQICSKTGSLITKSTSPGSCPEIITELFLPGASPEMIADDPNFLFQDSDLNPELNKKDFFYLEDIE